MTGDQMRTYTLQCIFSFLLVGFGLGSIFAIEVGFCFLGVGILLASITIVIGSRHARFLDAIGEAMTKHAEELREYHKRDVIMD